jgi:hypothetical protein
LLLAALPPLHHWLALLLLLMQRLQPRQHQHLCLGHQLACHCWMRLLVVLLLRVLLPALLLALAPLLLLLLLAWAPAHS